MCAVGFVAFLEHRAICFQRDPQIFSQSAEALFAVRLIAVIAHAFRQCLDESRDRRRIFAERFLGNSDHVAQIGYVERRQIDEQLVSDFGRHRRVRRIEDCHGHSAVEECFEARRFTADVERHNLFLAHAEFLQTEKQTRVGKPRKARDGDGLALEISPDLIAGCTASARLSPRVVAMTMRTGKPPGAL